jgi:hypothetical protein
MIYLDNPFIEYGTLLGSDVFQLRDLSKTFNSEYIIYMMNPLIIIDFNGALLRPRPFDEAHKTWFKLFSVLLEDDSVNEWAFKENILKAYIIAWKGISAAKIRRRRHFFRGRYTRWYWLRHCIRMI